MKQSSTGESVDHYGAQYGNFASRLYAEIAARRLVRTSARRVLTAHENATGWFDARARRKSELSAIEGDDAFDGQQTFLDTAAKLASEKRLSRVAILAWSKP